MYKRRSQQIPITETSHVFCSVPCVRRAFVSGNDPLTGRNFDHRRRWLVKRMKFLVKHFAIEICSYAIKKSKYEVVLKIVRTRAEAMSDDEVIARGLALFPSCEPNVNLLNVENRTEAQQEEFDELVREWRSRLVNISWFMRCLNEPIARMANREDDCTGRFWEGGFKCQALLDAPALLTCMAYVDTSHFRDMLAKSLAASDFNSIQERLVLWALRSKNRKPWQKRLLKRQAVKHLVDGKGNSGLVTLKPFSGMPGVTGDPLSIDERAYLNLLESSCRAIDLQEINREQALQLLDGHRELLQSIGIGSYYWLEAIQNFHQFRGAVGSRQSLVEFHRLMKKKGAKFKHEDKWIRGVGPAKRLFAA